MILKMTKNFIKADLRMPQLIFWDWFFPLIMMFGVSLFLRGSTTAQFLFPGLVSLIVFQSIIFSIPFRLAQFNEQGITKLIKAKGNISYLFESFFIARFFIIFLQIMLMLLMGEYVMKVPLKVNPMLLGLTTIMAISILFLIGILCGALVKTQNSALGIAQAVYFILVAISGIFYPLTVSPKWLQIMAKVSPLTYLNDFWKASLYSTTFTLEQLWPSLGILLLMIVVVAFLIFLKLKSEKKAFSSPLIAKDAK